MPEDSRLRTLGSAALLLLVVASLLVGAAGGAAAQTSTSTATATPTPTTTDSSGVIANDTVAVDNDTRSVYADLTAGENNSASLDVTFYGVDADGNETQLSTQTVSLNASEERLVERTSVNATKYSEYRVLVETSSGSSTNATAETGTVQKVAGGAGGGLLGGSGSIGAAGIVVILLLGAVALSGDD